MRPVLRKTLSYSPAHFGVAMACLVQWNGSKPWIRLDWFAGSYFALRLIGSLHSIVSSVSAFRSKPVRQEWWALTLIPQVPVG